MEGKRNYGKILGVGFGSQKPLRFMRLFFHLWFVLRAAVGLEVLHCGAARVFTQSCRQTPRVAPWGVVFGLWKRKAPLAVRVSVMAAPGGSCGTPGLRKLDLMFHVAEYVCIDGVADTYPWST